FELELHNDFRKKGYLAKDDIGKLFQKHMASYMGSAVLQSEGSQNWWIYWGHIRSFFYVYSYASGLLIAKAMQASYSKDKTFMDKVKSFLSAGTSDSPKNIFLKMSIDISDKKFWEEGLSHIDNMLKETQKLAKKLGKI
ncbi:MAG: M3 family metallopeptidase, partial [Patescibacteria group bacterium]